MSLKKPYILVFLKRNHEVLLGMKKRGFGVNKWNGIGGKKEEDETVTETAVRKLKEESCLLVKPDDLKKIGHLEFTIEGNRVLLDVTVFVSNTFEGLPIETEEMMPKWFAHDDIPYENMWPDNWFWFPYMLKDRLFYGHFHYEGYENILSYQIKELESMEELCNNRK